MGTKIQLKRGYGGSDLYVNNVLIEKEDVKMQTELFHKVVDAISNCEKTQSTFLRVHLYSLIASFSDMLDMETFDRSESCFINELELD